MIHRTGTVGAAKFAVSDRGDGASTAPYDSLNLGGHVGDDPEAVTVNRHRLAGELGLPPERMAYMSQVHGRDVAVLERPPLPGEPAPVADAMVTRVPGLALVVLTADCVPVLLADGAGVVGVAHAGRKGVEAGVVTAVVDAMQRLGTAPSDVAAVVGPAVCGRCYEVPAQMRDAVSSVAPAARATSRAGTPALDLPAAVAAQLDAAGVGSVQRMADCTAETAALFSHRRDTVTGRFAGVVWTAA